MARIPLVEAEGASDAIRATYARLEGLGFPLLNVMKLFGNDANILRGFAEIALALYDKPRLSPRYRELAYLRASQVNACHY
jgi:alkylhydroperoxidase family enzyme